MKVKKTTALFFILVLALQLLPVKQAIRYFFADSPLTEELVANGKAATKNFRGIEEYLNSIQGCNSIALCFSCSGKSLSVIFAETLPAFHTAEIPTPPPNTAS